MNNTGNNFQVGGQKVESSGYQQPNKVEKGEKEGHLYVVVDVKTGQVSQTQDKARASSLKEIHQFMQVHGKNLDQENASTLAKISSQPESIKKIDQANVPKILKICATYLLFFWVFAGNFMGIFQTGSLTITPEILNLIAEVC